jgi:hypothetical protein
VDDAQQPMTSVEKVRAQLAYLDELEPTDPEMIGVVLALTTFRPKLVAMLPADAAELDALLLKAAVWALTLRSDGAAALTLMPAEAPA